MAVHPKLSATQQRHIRKTRAHRPNAPVVRKSLVLIVVLEALAALQIAYYFRKLPGVVASHFNAAGIANAWQTKQTFMETYGIVLLGIAAVYFVVPRLLFTLPPEMIHLPNKRYWLAPERRTQTLDDFADRFAALGAGTLALVVICFQLVFQANLGGTALSGAVPALIAAYGAFAATWLALLLLRYRHG